MNVVCVCTVYLPGCWSPPDHDQILVVQVPSLEQSDAAGLVGDAAEDLQALLQRQEPRGIRQFQERSHRNHLPDVSLEVGGLDLSGDLKRKRYG